MVIAKDRHADRAIVNERGRRVMVKMWRVEQEHDVIGNFYYTLCYPFMFMLALMKFSPIGAILCSNSVLSVLPSSSRDFSRLFKKN